MVKTLFPKYSHVPLFASPKKQTPFKTFDIEIFRLLKTINFKELPA